MTALPPDSSCHNSSDAACQSLRDVYASPQFSNLDAQSGGDNVFTWIGRQILDLLNFMFAHLGVGPSMLLGTILLAVVIVFLVWRLRGNRGGHRRRLDDSAHTDLSDDSDAEWRAAVKAAAVGDFREAIRRAFRSALLEVAQRGRLRVDASWTTRELLRSARADADLVAALAPAAASFDAAWYSGREVAAADWEIARGRCEAIRVLAKRRVAVDTAVRA